MTSFVWNSIQFIYLNIITSFYLFYTHDSSPVMTFFSKSALEPCSFDDSFGQNLAILKQASLTHVSIEKASGHVFKHIFRRKNNKLVIQYLFLLKRIDYIFPSTWRTSNPFLFKMYPTSFVPHYTLSHRS